MSLEFDWMYTTPRLGRDPATEDSRRDEIKRRADLFATLGYDAALAKRRIRDNLAWEVERLGAHRFLGDVDRVVERAFTMAGRNGKKKKKR